MGCLSIVISFVCLLKLQVAKSGQTLHIPAVWDVLNSWLPWQPQAKSLEIFKATNSMVETEMELLFLP